MKIRISSFAGCLLLATALTATAHAGPASFNLDASCSEIIAPAGPLDSGFPVTPQAVVANAGTEPATFYVRMVIGTEYIDSALISDLAPQTADTVGFGYWIPEHNVTYPVRCSTMLTGDNTPGNDYRDTSAVVQAYDVAPFAIVAPADTVDSGSTLQPWLQVTNYGTMPATFYAHCFIGEWHDSAMVPALECGEVRDLAFTDWTATVSGPAVVRCSTGWEVDRYPSNDTFSRRFVVRGTAGGLDAGAVEVIHPVHFVQESVDVTPVGVVANYGTQAVEVTTRMAVELMGLTVYEDSVATLLLPGQFDTLLFQPWLAAPEGSYAAILRVAAPGDTNPSNDVFASPFSVAAEIRDVAVSYIVRPRGNIPSGPVTPSAWVRNYGTVAETFFTQLLILRDVNVAYRDSIRTTGLAPGESATVTFSPWNAPAGSYVVVCSTMLQGDYIPANDARRATLQVDTLPMPLGWREMRRVPVGTEEVKNGGCLTLVASNRMIYALKGNKTHEFYRYNPFRDSWSALPSLPVGVEGKPADKGASLCNDGNRYLYATKGNNTDDFYRYDIATDSWTALAVVPPGLSGKKVKGGTKLAYVGEGDSGFCYLLKGYKNEFYRFDIRSGQWLDLPAAPIGTSGKNSYKEGSFIVYDGAASIFAVKASYNEVFCFDLATSDWQARQYKDLPLYGRANKKKKVKDGGGGAWFGTSMVCIKGGNTQETWRFWPAQDSWFELDTIPRVGTTGKKKSIKGGGSIVHFGDATFYVLKGNKTYEFWRYRMPGGVGVEERAPLVQLRSDARVSVVPNPARELAYVSIVPGSSGTVRLYDVRGGLVLEQPLSRGAAALDCRALSSGIYFVAPSADGLQRSARLVVQH